MRSYIHPVTQWLFCAYKNCFLVTVCLFNSALSAPKIALLVETSREYARGLLRGVIRYQHEHGPWSIYFKPQGLGAPPPPWLSAWRGDGILARINDRRMADAVSRTSVPVVDLRNALPNLKLPTVAISNRRWSNSPSIISWSRDFGTSHFAARPAEKIGIRMTAATCSKDRLRPKDTPATPTYTRAHQSERGTRNNATLRSG